MTSVSSAEAFGIKVFLYGPPLWMFGKSPDEDGIARWEAEDYQKVCDSHESYELPTDTALYRVQTNIECAPEDKRFCSPPDEFRNEFGRFDSSDVPILYCALDIETCLHESRVSLEDDIFVATLQPNRSLRLLDLTTPAEKEYTSNFEDPTIWLRALIYDHHSYSTCQQLASHIHSLGYDGFIVKSYFQQAAQAQHKNVCLFGKPVISGDVSVKGVNRIQLRNVSYEYVYGPGLFNDEIYGG